MTKSPDRFSGVHQEPGPARNGPGSTLQSFADLVHHFFELREKGSSLSPADLDVLARWQKLGICPSALAREMDTVKQECDDTGSLFPLTLNGLEKMMARLRHRYVEGLPGGTTSGPSGTTPRSREGDDVEQKDSSTAI